MKNHVEHENKQEGNHRYLLYIGTSTQVRAGGRVWEDVVPG